MSTAPKPPGCLPCRVNQKGCPGLNTDGVCEYCRRRGFRCEGFGVKYPGWTKDQAFVQWYKRQLSDQEARASLGYHSNTHIVTAVPEPSSPPPIFVTPAFSVQIPQQQHASPPHQDWFLGAAGHNEDSLHVTQGFSPPGVGQGNGWQRASHMPSQSTQQVDPRGSSSFTFHAVSHPNEPLRGPSLNPDESSHHSALTNGPYRQGYAGYPNANPDDTHRAGAYEQTCYYGERPTGSSRRQGGSSGVDQDIGEDHIAARTFLQSLFPGIVPTVEQINLVLYTVRRVLSEF